MKRAIKLDCGIRFRLREPNAAKSTPIICIVEYDAKPVVKIPTGVKVKPADWSDRKQEAKSGLRNLQAGDAYAINTTLSRIKLTIQTRFREYVLKHHIYPAKPVFKETVMRELRGEPRPGEAEKTNDPSLLNFISGQILAAKSGTRIKISGSRRGTRFAPDTIRDYTVVLNLLQRFCAAEKKTDLTFDDITLNFYRKLQEYMYGDMGYSLNYFGKIVKSIKAFMREAQELGYHKNEAYKSSRFVKPQEETDAIYLNTDQLDALLRLDLSRSAALENARDLFLIGCWTGLRFSDLSQLSKQDVVGSDFIHIKTQKTGATVAIPVLPALKEIISRYQGQTESSLPHPISNQKLNAYIKEAGKMAGFDQPVEITKPVAGERKTVTVPFYQLITTHTARRSFATNMYRTYGLRPSTIMKVTGHKSEAVFFKYIRITPEENARMILEAVMKKEAAKAERSTIHGS
ncbi:site-specific integrase [Anseongella ginsenosidimutans]|nr:site-specific integrase [Anseongella ginsenosidimutans]QEC51981.1 site-specific integrase [Anseongella ginsenosidimutans]